MSVKNTLPAIFAGLTVILTASNYRIKPTCKQLNSQKPLMSLQSIDALRVHFDTSVYKIDTILHAQQLPGYIMATRIKPHVVETTAIKNGVRYVMSNGDHIERRGGTIAWRNNNPGCIRYSAHAIELGATGKANGFAVFPDEETGTRAIASLLRSDSYLNLTIGAAITKYAPPHENDTQNYINNVCRMTGLSNKLRICDLNSEQMVYVVNAIRTIEGWREGTETTTAVKKPDIDFDKYARTLKLKSSARLLEHTL